MITTVEETDGVGDAGSLVVSTGEVVIDAVALAVGESDPPFGGT